MPTNYRSSGIIAGIASIAVLAGCESTGITDVDFQGSGSVGPDFDAPIEVWAGDNPNPPTPPLIGYGGPAGTPGDLPHVVIGYEDQPGVPGEVPELGYWGDTPDSPQVEVGYQDEPDAPGKWEEAAQGDVPGSGDIEVGYQDEPDAPGQWEEAPQGDVPGSGDIEVGYQDEPDAPGTWEGAPRGEVPGSGDIEIGYEDQPGAPGLDIGYQEPDPGVGVPDPVEVALPGVGDYPFEFDMLNLVGNDGWGAIAVDFHRRALELVVGGFEANVDKYYEIWVEYAALNVTAFAGSFEYENANGRGYQTVEGLWDLPVESSSYADRFVVIEKDHRTPGSEGEEVLTVAIEFDYVQPKEADQSAD